MAILLTHNEKYMTPYISPNSQNFCILKDIGIEEHDGG